MSINKRFVAGNWKMNGDLASNEKLLKEIITSTKESCSEIVVFPPFVYLNQVSDLLLGSHIVYGAQNVAAEENGAFTGEVSASMLNDLGCKYVLVGHSERRAYYGETNELIAKKINMAHQYKITPVFCIGETEDERESQETNRVIKGQLEDVIKSIGIKVFENIIIAYEPVWAIGTGKSATADEAEAVHAFIRCTLAEYDANISNLVRIVYGGSVNGDNVNDLFIQKNINGGLVGGASLKASDFTKIALA